MYRILPRPPAWIDNNESGDDVEVAFPLSTLELMQKLYVILDPSFGERLRQIDANPVWIVKSEINEPIVRSLWSSNSQPDRTKGITAFTLKKELSPEDLFLAELDTIDLHHGPYSTNSPYTTLEVVGARLTHEIRTNLSEIGFTSFAEYNEGFTATRSQEEAKKLRR